MVHAQARKRVQRFQAFSHAIAGFSLLFLALSEEQGGGLLPWVAGVAAVLLLGLVGWEQLQPGAQPPSAERVKAFAAILTGRGITVHVRRRRGDDIDAACGQLRLKRERGEV